MEGNEMLLLSLRQAVDVEHGEIKLEGRVNVRGRVRDRRISSDDKDGQDSSCLDKI